VATERIIISVEARNTRVVKREIEEVGEAGKRAASGIDALKAALAGVGAVAVAREFIRLADTFTNMSGRVRQVTGSMAGTRVVMQELLEISNRTRQSFESTVDIYARVGQAVKDLGISQRETIQFTETLNQLVATSGASASAANAAIVQLGQGLASGTLRGDELNSVLEQLPNVADVIARGLGVTRGQLRKLGEEGKITARQVLDAFRKAREEVSNNFANSVPTIAGAFQVLQNNVLALVGRFDAWAGSSRALVTVLTAVSTNLETLARSAAAAGIVIATVLVGKGINALILGLRALAVAALANPFTALATVLLATTAYLIAFSDQIMVTAGGMANLQEVSQAAWEEIKAQAQSAWETIKTIFSESRKFWTDAFGEPARQAAEYISSAFSNIAGSVGSAFSGLQLNFQDVLRGAGIVVDSVIALFVGCYRAIVAAFSNLPGALYDLFARALNGITELVERTINSIISGINTIGAWAGRSLLDPVSLGRAETIASRGGQSLGESVAAGFDAGIRSIGESRPVGQFVERALAAGTELVDRVATRANAIGEQRRERERLQAGEDAAARAALERTGTNRTPAADANARKGRRQVTFADLLAELQGENSILRANRDERKALAEVLRFEERLRRSLTEAERAQVIQLARENELLDRQNQLYDDLVGPQEKLQERLEDLNTLYQQGRINAQQYGEEMLRLRVTTTALDNSMTGGISNAFARLAERSNDLGKSISDAIVGALDEATEAWIEFTRTGEFNLQKLADSLYATGTRIAMNQLMANALQAIMGAGSGMSGATGTGGTATGGSFDWGKLIGTVAPAIIGGMSGGGSMGAPKAFATGGSFMVGGDGGVDSQLVSFRASPGERVDVTTPAQQRSASSGPTQQNTVVQNFQIMANDPNAFRASQQQIQKRGQLSAQRSLWRNA